MISIHHPNLISCGDLTARTTFESFIEDAHPCVGALSALHRDRMHFDKFAPLGSGEDIERLCNSLRQFSKLYSNPGVDPVSFIAMFDGSVATEIEFETVLWNHLQDMHDFDHQQFGWDPTVSANPQSSEFSFSLGGRAYYVIGLHPAASRMSRRSPMPCVVFNFHEQFELLRANCKYSSFQRAIQTRDMKLQGSLNPVLTNFGTMSEARQYSGRNVGADWKCPFHGGK